MDRIIKQTLKEVGFSGLKKLAVVLSTNHNNRDIAKEFGLSVFQTVYLSNNISLLCHEILQTENQCTAPKIKSIIATTPPPISMYSL
jgi:hypothetical protein